MRDVELLKTNPKELFDKYMQIIIDGGSLDDTQLIMLEAARKIIARETDGI
jgi:hypothetical protein